MTDDRFHGRPLMAGIALSLFMSAGVLGQSRAAPAAEAELLASGWHALAGGNVEQADAIARNLQKQPGSQRSAAAVAYLVETGTRLRGYLGGLDAYEQWLGTRSLEASYALRPVAVAALKDIASSRSVEALDQAVHALEAEGLVGAVADVKKARALAAESDLLASVRSGDEAAVGRLLDDISSNPHRVRSAAIEALAKSGDPRAAGAVTPLLTSDRDDLQVAAALAVADLGARAAIADLVALLDSPMFHVKFSAASALYRLGNDAGVPVLQQASLSEHPAIRVGAAEALAVRPDPAWLAMVRALAQEQDPEVRVRAAALLAEHDPAVATRVMEELMTDSNPAIRQLAGLRASEQRLTDPKLLRILLRSTDPRVRARAGSQLLALTR